MDDRPGRKEPPKFEPPPWEREQFDAMAERRAAEEARAAAEKAEAEKRMRAEQEAATEAEAEAEKQLPRVAEETESSEGASDEALSEVDQMMAVLQVEEPPAARSLWKAGVAAGAFMVVIGAVFMVWGIVAFQATRGAGAVGQLGAGILVFFGVGFIAIAAWTIQRSLRQRGAS